MPLRRVLRIVAVFGALCLWVWGAQAEGRLDAIRARGHLVCGVAYEDPGFALRQPDGHFEGLEIDLCRALAAAVLGSADKVRFMALDTVHEFLAEPRMDLVFHRLSWALTREAPGQLAFGPVYFFEAGTQNRLEPLAPLLRSGDEGLARTVRWVVQALLEAELLGINSTRARQMPATPWPGAETGMALDLPADWALRMVAQVGNYAEIYDRHLGPKGARALPRGPNRLWRDGGLMVPLLVH